MPDEEIEPMDVTPISTETPPEPEPVAEPPKPDLTSFGHDEFVAEATRRGMIQPPVVETPHVDPRIAQIVELQYTDPTAAENLRIQVAQDRMMQAIAPTVGPMVQQNATAKAVAHANVGDKGREYIELAAKQSDMNYVIGNPLALDALTRAARDYEREKTPPQMRYESSGSETGPLSPTWQAGVSEFEREFGEKPDPLAVSMARKEAS